MANPTPFDLCAPLDSGTTLLEASAGTGKTHAIASLALRLIAERGLRIDQILIVTFGTAATQELRSRVFQRLQDGLSVLDGAPSSDPLLSFLATTDVELKQQRIKDALNHFDRAEIATTHTFCSKMLARLGVIADWDGLEHFTPDLTTMMTNASDDVYVHMFAQSPTRPFSQHEGRGIAYAAIEHPNELCSFDDSAASAFATEVRNRVRLAKARGRCYTYDDFIDQMMHTLNDPITREPARQRLGESFRAVLVDEFQDTDPAQWTILREAFVGTTDVYLIGDPKQSIYGFRNADLKTYLAAQQVVDHHRTLHKNYRSDSVLVDAIVDLFADVALGDPSIVVSKLDSAYPRRIRGQHDATIEPIRLRLAESQASVNADAALQIRHLLDTAMIFDKEWRRVRCSDIAILVRSGWRGRQIQSRLEDASIPSSFPGTQSIFHCAAADTFDALLRAWTSPNTAIISKVALSQAIGLHLDEVVADADQLADIATTIRANAMIAGESIHNAWAHLRRTFGSHAVLAAPGGSAAFANLEQLAQLLDSTRRRESWTLEQTHAWLVDNMDKAKQRSKDDVTRRADSDADAVSIMTVHAAKGLSFPIVLLPSGCEWYSQRSSGSFVFAGDGARRLFVGTDTRNRAKPLQAHIEEAQAEELRLLYVAMTRAQSHVIAWWANTKQTPMSALHRLLSREPRNPIVERSYPCVAPRWPKLPTSVVEHPVSVPDPTASAVSVNPSDLRVREFPYSIDQTWRRVSYSALTATSHSFANGSDEPELVDDTHDTSPLPLGDAPRGAAFGSLVHHMLEYLDWSVDDLESELRRGLAESLAAMPIEGADVDSLTPGLLAALTTPLGSLTEGRALVDLPTSARLAELDFDLPLCPQTPMRVRDIAQALRRHLPKDDLLASYPSRLADSPAAQETLNGYLTGSIDAVFRIDDRYVVLDYKTNVLPSDGPLQTHHYRAKPMAEAMIAAHYPLQAILYSVALHRYLGWRVPGYDPQKHLGGVGYLFVRGMNKMPALGDDTMPAGVFTWYPPVELICELSQSLAGHHA